MRNLCIAQPMAQKNAENICCLPQYLFPRWLRPYLLLLVPYYRPAQSFPCRQLPRHDQAIGSGLIHELVPEPG